MTITVVYIYPAFGGGWDDNASRFIATYNMHPPGADHKLVVVSNGGEPTIEMRALFDALNHPVEWMTHDNSGLDLGGFQAAARAYSGCDMMLFFGSSAYLRGLGWLRRMSEAFQRHGNGRIYGCTANCGDARVNVYPHIRTTGFFLSPALMNMHPLKVTRADQRYAFEHGPMCLSEWGKAQGYKSLLVTWIGEHEWPSWDSVPGGFHRDKQEAIIAGDRLTAPPFYAYS